MLADRQHSRLSWAGINQHSSRLLESSWELLEREAQAPSGFQELREPSRASSSTDTSLALSPEPGSSSLAAAVGAKVFFHSPLFQAPLAPTKLGNGPEWSWTAAELMPSLPKLPWRWLWGHDAVEPGNRCCLLGWKGTWLFSLPYP